MDETLRQILDRHGRLARPAAGLAEDADLFAAGLDSLAIVNLMLAIEDAFDIEIPDEQLNRASFASLRAMRTMIGGLPERNPAA